MTVKFTSKNTAVTPTLNVNNTGAKTIRDYNGNELTKAAREWLDGAAIALTYDGTYWRIQDSDLMERVYSAKTAIEQNATNIALKANSSDVYNKASVDGFISKEVTDRNAAIKTASDNINLSVSQNYTTKTEFNNLEIGGRNLLLQSKSFGAKGEANRIVGRYNNNELIVSRNDGFNEVQANANFRGIAVYIDSMGFAVGDKLVLSANIRSDSTVGTSIIFYCIAVNSSGSRIQDALLHLKTRIGEVNYTSVGIYNNYSFAAGSEDRAVVEITWLQAAQDLLDAGGNICFTIQATSSDWSKGNVAMWAPKLERGNKPTDWTPAPEDVESQIDEKISEAKLEIDADGIRSEVSKINSVKYLNSATSSWTLASIKTIAAEGHTEN